MKVCPYCGLENPSHAESCAECDADLSEVRASRPMAPSAPPQQYYQQPSVQPYQVERAAPKKSHTLRNALLIIVALIIVGGAIGGTQAGKGGGSNIGVVGAPTATSPTVASGPVITETPTASAPSLTMSQEQAVGKAQDYLEYTAFSRQGLIDQLVYEGFSTADATFAVDYLSPDWNEQAVKKASDYLEYSSFSRSGLIEQLIFEGFTRDQATYGANAVGY